MAEIRNYQDFLIKKRVEDTGSGFNLDRKKLNPIMFEFQKDICLWSLRKGRTLVGADCGLGKGLIELEWLKQVHLRTDKPVIMFAPPGVKTQFKYEAEKFGYEVWIVAEDNEIRNGINITNYERLIKRDKIIVSDWPRMQKEFSHYQPIELKRDIDYVYFERFRFNPELIGGIALDEASILKHYGAKTRERLTRFSKQIPFRICGTATPAPNDFMELINYADFLGIMNGKQCRAMFFIQDGNSSNKYRIKKPAWKPFWKWMSNWSVMIKTPSDLGYANDGYVLPEMNMHLHQLNDNNVPEGMLFALPAKSLSEQSRVKRLTVEDRCKVAAEIANNIDTHCIVWCERNDESALLKKLIPDAIEVVGSHTEQYKETAFMDFAQGKHRVIITKPSMGGLGMNWQVCANQVFVNIDHSHEKQYQAIRRSWRFGQENDVNIHLIAMDTEGDILANIQRKEKQAITIFEEIVANMNIHELQQKTITKEEMDYRMDTHIEDYWSVMLGDTSERIYEMEDGSIDCVMTSVPFPAMYAYTNSERDIGNYAKVDELVNHLQYVFIGLLAKMKPGRVCHIHLSQGVAHLNREGFIGLWDFRGPMIQMMTDMGWLLHSERTIEKDPQTERARSNTLGLMFMTLKNDASHMRASVGDFLIEFRAPGTNDTPIPALLASVNSNLGKYDSDGWVTEEMWINWASNVWYKHRRGMKWWEGIDVTNVCGSLKKSGRQGFGVKDGRGQDDEKHLCELQLDVIERCIALHSNPGELVFDPFNGIGSTGFQALKMGRRYAGIELKESYYYTTIKNLQWVENDVDSKGYDLFSLAGVESGENTLTKRHKQWMSERAISLSDKATNWSNWETSLNETK